MAFLYIQCKTRKHRSSIHQVVTQEAVLVWSLQQKSWKKHEHHLELSVTTKVYKKHHSTNTVLQDLNQTFDVLRQLKKKQSNTRQLEHTWA